MFSEMEVRIANATNRSCGASVYNPDGSIRAVVPRYVAEHISKDKTILDFGAGKQALHTLWLRDQGFQHVVAYDFGANYVEGIHDANARHRMYDVVMASNVINTLSSMDMLWGTLGQIQNVLKEGGVLICNYPSSPRKLALSASEMQELVGSEIAFSGDVYRVAGTSSAPVWEVIKRSVKAIYN